MKELTGSSFERCKSNSSWIEKNHISFERCTQQLIKSLPWLMNSFSDIERFSAQNVNSTMSCQAQLGILLENAKLNPHGSNALQMTLSFLKNTPIPTENLDRCSNIPGCQENARKVIIQLMLIELGILGLGSATPGMFLANHYSALGPYYGNVEEHQWPHSPLSKDPSDLELDFHGQMVKITEVISNGTLKNVSILDLPGFGSKIPWLRLKHKRQPNWPIELNFAIRNNIANDVLAAFTEYKTLIIHWQTYLEKVFQKDPKATFTPEMSNNQLFNFTDYIRQDIKAFLIATHGSYLTSEEHPLPIWKNVTEILFNSTIITDDMNEKNQYEKLIMECAFQRNLLKKKSFNHDGGCDLFHPTLTTNGLCHTFNSEAPSDVWKSSETTNAFQDLFPWEHSKEVFHDSGVVEGKSQLLSIFFCLQELLKTEFFNTSYFAFFSLITFPLINS